MTPEQVASRSATASARSRPIAEQAARRLFYGRLFEIAPEVQPLFKASDIEASRAAS